MLRLRLLPHWCNHVVAQLPPAEHALMMVLTFKSSCLESPWQSSTFDKQQGSRKGRRVQTSATAFYSTAVFHAGTAPGLVQISRWLTHMKCVCVDYSSSVLIGLPYSSYLTDEPANKPTRNSMTHAVRALQWGEKS